MPKSTRGWLFWTPRVGAMAFAAFLAVFALDVFGDGRGFWGTIAALLMHLLPSILVVSILLLAWRREWIGAAVYVALGLTYVVTTAGRMAWTAHLAIAGPLLVIGGLFFLGWRARRATPASA